MGSFLVKIDLSGIQDFIFNVKSKGAAKDLKAKSFYVMALTEVVLSIFKKRFGDSYELLFDGGGNAFFTLAKVSEEDINDLIDDIYSDRITGIKIVIDHIEYCDVSFSDTIKRLNRIAIESKYSLPFRGTPFEKPKSFDWSDLTDRLIRHSGYHLLETHGNDNSCFDILGYRIDFRNDLTNLRDNPNLIMPKANEYSLLDFDEIAEIAYDETGTEYLAALKLDVDNLGNLFEQLQTEYQFNDMSKIISTFFKDEIYKMLNTDSFRNRVYVVFSGGDDCFLIGPWNTIFGLAEQIRSEYYSYSINKIQSFNNTYHTDIQSSTLSASIVVTSPNFPMIQIAHLAETELHKAKYNDDSKNKISVFGYVLTWEEFDKAKEIALKLKEFVVNKGESRALIQRISKSHKGFEPLLSKANDGKIDIPAVWRLKYYLRNVKNKENLPAVEKLFDEYTQSIIDSFMGKKSINPNLFIVAARWAEFLTKTKKEEVQNG